MINFYEQSSDKEKGVVQTSNIIALTDEVNLPVGTTVEVQFKVVKGKPKVDRSVFGMWKDRKDLEDSLQWVRQLREEMWREPP